MTATMENYLKKHLGPLVTAEQLSLLLKTTSVIGQLPPDLRSSVLKVFADGYTLQMKITTGFSALQLLTISMIWKDPHVSVMGKDAPGIDVGG